jgi:hypothetical protein
MVVYNLDPDNTAARLQAFLLTSAPRKGYLALGRRNRAPHDPHKETTMRQNPLPILALALLAIAPAPSLGRASEQDQAPPPAPPSLYLMADIQVDVSRAPEYEAALKDLITALASSAFLVTFDTYATDDSRYFLIYGLEGFGSTAA